MSTFYADLASTADGMLKEFGAPATLIRVAGAAVYDPATGTTVPSAEAKEEPIIAAVFDYAEGLINGSLIQVGDKQAYVSVLGVDPPKTSDVVVWAGARYTIVKPLIMAPAGENVLYQLQMRR